MWFHVDPGSGVPIYLQIVNQVKRATAIGLLKAGDQMPSVREMALELAVNPNTISKAYQELERDGVIKSARGVGTFVADKEIKLVPEERMKNLMNSIDRLLVEAHHLGFSEDAVKTALEERIKEWKVKRK